jgi:glutathione S-transferase
MIALGIMPRPGSAGMITLHQYEISPFCDKARRVLHAKGVDYRIEEVSVLDTLRAG